MPVGRRPITKAFYDAMVEVLRDNFGNFRAAQRILVKHPANKAGTCSIPTIKNAWDIGYPKYGLKPIKEVVKELDEQEKKAARAKLNSMTIEESKQILGLDKNAPKDLIEKEQSREAAIIARAAEAKLVRDARNNVIELLNSSGELLAGYSALTKEVRRFLANHKIETITGAQTAIQLLWRISTTTKRATDAGMKVLQMERLLLGQPMEIIGTKDVDEISDEDALKELEEAAQAAERIRQRSEKDFHLSGIMSGNLSAHGFGKKKKSKSNGKSNGTN
jgi:hypothetical protein